MKTTGVVRRIDDLGRIVIPKEIRRTLRIRDGEPLEIYIDKESITLKKHSSIEDLTEIAKNLVDTISKSLTKTILISDRSQYMAVSKEKRKKYIGKHISKYLEEIMEFREAVTSEEVEELALTETQSELVSYVVVPIIMSGDPIGLVIIMSEDENTLEFDEKIAYIISSFLAKHIEE